MEIENLPPAMRHAIESIAPSPVGLVATMLVRDAVFAAATAEEAQFLIDLALESFERAIAAVRRDLAQS